MPPRTSRGAAIAWARGHEAWVKAQISRQADRLPFESGVVIPIDGVDVRLEWIEGAPRAVRRGEGTLTCGGPRESFGSRIEAWLKRLARDRLSAETAAVAKQAGVTVRSVSIGDADTRWGSCSSSGAIRYNWRLILAPPDLRRYVVAHEVAHRLHMNHGAAFKATEALLYGGPISSSRLLLRRLGPVLRRIGRSG